MTRTITTALIICLLSSFMAQNADAKTYKYDLDGDYSIDPDGTLFLNTDDAEVTIVGEDRSDVLVVIYHECRIEGFRTRGGDDFEMIVTEENGNLRIREADTDGITIVMGSVRELYTVSIRAPKTVNLRIRGEDDDYRIHGFSGDLRLDCEDGDAILYDMSGDHFEISMEDGDLDMEGGNGMLDMSAEDGRITIEEGNFSDVTCDVEDGDIFLSTNLDSDGNYRLNAEDGGIEFTVLDGGGEFRLSFEDGRARASRDFDMVEEDDNYEEYTLDGGEAIVRINVEDGRISLRKK
ncbi:hypothetical protein BMS3Bbin04_00625 [bacterium BMS3Bbin04]|nr:hypothetical protein BMS3Bbin04_00625 [bacterium BMS3Bbin04]